ncbi:MAG: RraA family protein [Acidobacteriaceae bacterium]|nr:RraA family protein [Acidobacteriaceae bacterium]
MSSKITLAAQRHEGKPVESADLELFKHIETTLYTAVLSDALDEVGIRDRAMREYLRPIAPDIVFAGWARTILCMDIHYIPEDPYTLEIQAVDSILPGEVVVVGTGASVRNAPWGELLSTAAMARGARGAVVDGLIRDVKKILNLGFPVFASGMKPVDSRGRGLVVDYNIPVECGGVTVTPGDLIVADFDGVVTIPASAVDEVVRLATDKVSRENSSRAELMSGKYLRDVFNKYGVL